MTESSERGNARVLLLYCDTHVVLRRKHCRSGLDDSINRLWWIYNAFCIRSQFLMFRMDESLSEL